MSIKQRENLLIAEKKASNLFLEIEKRGLIIPGKYERDLNSEIFDLAYELYGIKKYWHKNNNGYFLDEDVVKNAYNKAVYEKENEEEYHDDKEMVW